MKLNFREITGNEPPVIFLHGLFGSSDNFYTIAKQLGYKSYLLDLRNHGKSPHSEEHSYPEMAKDVKEFFVNNNIKFANVIGHSMGGKVAMKFAIENPNLVSQLIIVDIAPKTYNSSHLSILESMIRLDLENIKSRKEADEKLKETISDKRTRLFLLKNLIRNKKDKFNWTINLESLYKNINDLKGNFNIKEIYEGRTLFIKGENSNYIEKEDLKKINQIFTNSKIETIMNSGHWVHSEQKDFFLESVKKFINNK